MEQLNKEKIYQEGVSVILPANDPANFTHVLEAFLKNNSHYPLEIIVLDQSGGEEITEVISKYYTLVFIVQIKLTRPLSLLTSLTYAAEKAIYPGLLFLSSTTAYSKDNLSRGLEKLRARPRGEGRVSLLPPEEKKESHEFILWRRDDFLSSEPAAKLAGAKTFSKGAKEACSTAEKNELSPALKARVLQLQQYFKPFEPEHPVLSIHVPKTAGTSFRAVLEGWFGRNFFLYYPDIALEEVKQLQDLAPGQCVHGHFNRRKHFGLEHFAGGEALERANIITVLRDPYRMLVSLFFYYKYQASQEVIEKSVLVDERPQEFKPFFDLFLQKGHFLFSYLFPSPGFTEHAMDPYLKNYTFIGIQEELALSVQLLAAVLGKKPPELPQKNLSDYTKDEIPDLREQAREAFIEEYRLYDRVKAIMLDAKS